MWRSIGSKSIHATRRFTTSPKLTKVHTYSRALTPTSIPSRFSPWVLSTNQGRRFFSNFSESETDHTPLSSSAEYGDNFVENGDITHLENENLGASEQVSWDVVAEEDNQSHGQGNEDEVYVIDKEKLEAVLSFLQSTVEGSLKSTLNGMGLDLHEDFLVKVLQAPLILGENRINFFKWAMNKNSDISVTKPVVDALVRAICSDHRKKDAFTLWNIMQEIGEKGYPVLNVGILNQVIALFSMLGEGMAALEVFHKFGDFGCIPDADTYYYTVEALCRRSDFDSAYSVCEKMLNAALLPDNKNVGKIISWMCKGSKLKVAHLVYMMAKEQNKYPPLSDVKFMIVSLCRNDETVKIALDILDDFSGEVRKYAIKPFSSVVRGLCRIKDVDGAKQLVCKMIAEGPPPGNAVFNGVITAYSKGGDMEKAIQMLKLLESRGLKPDVYAYTVIMTGFACGGQMEEACKLLSEAKRKHFKLSPVTYHTLIRGYCKLEKFDKALELFREMKKYGVRPNVDEYTKFIRSLCFKALDWETAEKLLNEMKESGLHPNGMTKALVRGVKELVVDGLENEARIEA
ncbi:hypothetical protein K2173_010910 [Erythroxylum novogranatense]|uniref:Pentatricopeptide repeat-containing protein n=1 Tax=Erythroxylum novogranatense TaxID=1862640 RepID=A0AAV8T108_9ROSI|nr:hypothetical protein K2173_010910 [Erythroxylum novogranatense]